MFVFEVRDADDFIVSKSRVKDGPVPVSHNENTTLVECPEVDYRAVGDVYMLRSNNTLHRYKYTGGVLAEQPDTRPTGTWSETSVKKIVDDSVTPVTLTLSITPTASKTLHFAGGKTIRPAFVGGVATLRVTANNEAAKIGTRNYGACNEIYMTNTLEIVVMEDEELMT